MHFPIDHLNGIFVISLREHNFVCIILIYIYIYVYIYIYIYINIIFFSLELSVVLLENVITRTINQ